jgi:hypothetical protein
MLFKISPFQANRWRKTQDIEEKNPTSLGGKPNIVVEKNPTKKMNVVKIPTFSLLSVNKRVIWVIEWRKTQDFAKPITTGGENPNILKEQRFI